MALLEFLGDKYIYSLFTIIYAYTPSKSFQTNSTEKVKNVCKSVTKYANLCINLWQIVPVKIIKKNLRNYISRDYALGPSLKGGEAENGGMTWAPAAQKSHFINCLRHICNTINQTTAYTIATTLIHFKIDYCNSLLLNLPATQTNRLQFVLNHAACAATKTPKFHHNTPIPESLHWLKINERI